MNIAEMKWVYILFIVFLQDANCAKILNVAYIPSYSHYILGHRLSEELTTVGHEVTYVHVTEKPFKEVTYRSIQLKGYHEVITKSAEEQNSGGLMGMPPSIQLNFIFEISLKGSRFILSHEKLQALLSENFDLVITEEFLSDALKGLCHHFDAVCVGFSSLPSNFMNNHIVGNPSPASYIPHTFLPYNKMNFLQRANNLYYNVYSYYLYHHYLREQDNILHEFLPETPDVPKIVRTTSLILLNSHPSVTAPVPLVPSMIEIGGFHITPAKKLPADLQTFLDNAKGGTIFFSLGSNVNSTMLSEATRRGILKAFERLKLKVLWKFEDESLREIPDNVLIRKWLPQQEILAHPNLKVFVTHGGLLSTMEACYYGVPLVGVPLFGDQQMNMQETVNKGVGLSIDIHDLGEETMYGAINTILSDDSFKENAIKQSEKFHDRPMKPLATSVYWIEYALRHKGAHHLKIAALDLAWYQYYLLDVLAMVSLMVVLIIWLIRKVIRNLCLKNPKQVRNEKKMK